MLRLLPYENAAFKNPLHCRFQNKKKKKAAYGGCDCLCGAAEENLRISFRLLIWLSQLLYLLFCYTSYKRYILNRTFSVRSCTTTALANNLKHLLQIK